ncbi:MAG: hypothetical protein PVG54_13375 [Anaerolineae bacterium]
MNVLGWILRTAYRLRRHLWLGWSLARWASVLLLALAVVALFTWWPNPWPAALLTLLCVGFLLLLAWTARQRYLRFEPLPPGAALPHSPSTARPLRKEEMVPVRASGQFVVQQKTQHFADVEADFETVGTREHIVLGRVHPSRFLLLGRWPSEDLGWWYIFFEPPMIRDMMVGHLHHGPQPSLAIRIVYESDPETQQTTYLSSDDASILHRIWNDLLIDAPPDVLDQVRQFWP